MVWRGMVWHGMIWRGMTWHVLGVPWLPKYIQALPYVTLMWWPRMCLDAWSSLAGPFAAQPSQGYNYCLGQNVKDIICLKPSPFHFDNLFSEKEIKNLYYKKTF